MYLLSQMWIYLLAAGLVGGIAGFLVRRACTPEASAVFVPTVASLPPLLSAPAEPAALEAEAAEALAAKEADLTRLQAWLENEQDQRLDAEKRVAEWMAAAADGEAQRTMAVQARERLEDEVRKARRDRDMALRAQQDLDAAQAVSRAAQQDAEQARALLAALREEAATALAQHAETLEKLQASEAAAAASTQTLKALSQSQAQWQAEVRQARQQVLALKEEHALQLSQRNKELAALSERLRVAEAQSHATASDELGLRAQLQDLLGVRQAMAERQAQLQQALDAARQEARAHQEALQSGAARGQEAQRLDAEVLKLRAELSHLKDVQAATAGARTGLNAAGAHAIVSGQLERLVLAAGEGRRPAALQLADGEQPDDLRGIDGIGPANERWLHSIGIYYFHQIAAWSPEEMAWIARHMPRFGSRVYRENWVAQSERLAHQTRISA